MSIECITRDNVILLRVRCREDGNVDFGELSSMADRLFHGNTECVLSFPDHFVPVGKQMGYIVLWCNTIRLGGGTLGIVTSNRMFIDMLSELDFAFQIRLYKSEQELSEFGLKL